MISTKSFSIFFGSISLTLWSLTFLKFHKEFYLLFSLLQVLTQSFPLRQSLKWPKTSFYFLIHFYTLNKPNTFTIKQSGYKRRTISINDDVYSRLRQKGNFGESFGRLITRILDQTDDAGKNRK